MSYIKKHRIIYSVLTWFIITSQVFTQGVYADSLATPKLSRPEIYKDHAITELARFEICYGHNLLREGQVTHYVNYVLEERYRARREDYKNEPDPSVKANIALGPVEFTEYDRDTGEAFFRFRNNSGEIFRVSLSAESGDYLISRTKAPADLTTEDLATLSKFRTQIRDLADKGARIVWASDMDDSLTPAGSKASSETIRNILRIIANEPFLLITGVAFDKMERQILSQVEEAAKSLGHEESLVNLVAGSNNGSDIYTYDIKAHSFVRRLNLNLKKYLEENYEKVLEAISKCIEEKGLRTMLNEVMGWNAPRGSFVKETDSQITFAVLGKDATTEDKLHFTKEEDDKNSKYYKVREKVYVPFLTKAFHHLGVEIEVRKSGLSSIDITPVTKDHAISMMLQLLMKGEKLKKKEPITVIFSGDSFNEGENDYPAISIADIIVNVGHDPEKTIAKPHFDLIDHGPAGLNTFLVTYAEEKFHDGPESDEPRATPAEKKPKVSLSILTASDDRVVEEVREAQAAGISTIHVDYLDGKFTPGSEGPFDCTGQVKNVSAIGIPLEVHLMSAEPEFSLVEKMIAAGLKSSRDKVCVHYESFKNKKDLTDFIGQINNTGLAVSLVLNPETPVSVLNDISSLLGKEVKSITLMAIVPGAVSRPFIPTTLEKIGQLRKLLYEKNIDNVEIETDGGISDESLESVVNSGIDMFVSRTWLLKSGRDLKEALGRLKEISAGVESERGNLEGAFRRYGVLISQFLLDAVAEFCAGRDAFTKDDLLRYIKKMPGVTDVKIGKDRTVDIYYGDKLLRLHNKAVIPVEYLGLKDRIYYKGITVKVYEGNFVRNGKKGYVLGISGSWHDSTAVLLKDGKIISALEEERMTRTKHDTSAFPVNAIHELLRRENITLNDIGYIAIGWNYNMYVDTLHSRAPSDEFFAGMDEAFARKAGVPKDELIKRNVADKNKSRFSINSLQAFLTELKSYYGTNSAPQVAFVRHHLAHAASAYYPSGFKESTLVLALDGYGDTETGSVWLGKDGDMEEVAHFELPNSLGWVWAAMTEYLNFRPTFAEGEVMGFAPYGEPRDETERTRVEKLRELFRGYIYFDHRTGTFRANPAYLYYGAIAPGKIRVTQTLVDKLTALGIPPCKKNTKEIDPLLTEDRPYANLAFVLQETTDELVADVISYYLQRNPKTKNLKKLAYGGGIALNILANGKIISEGLIAGEDIFVQPAASDSGTAIGAALVVAKEVYGKNVGFEMSDAFYGPEYNDSDIEKILRKYGLVEGVDYHRVSDDRLIEEAAQCINNKQPIAWFQGRSELGPRALGSRSVLLNLLDDTANNTANAIKGRQPWRPSASSVEETAARDYFVGIGKSPFMVIAFDVNTDKKHLMASGVHQYGKRLARPQTVSEKANPLYWRLLKRVGELIGVPAVVNTSFNKQEPLVESPEEAINTFRYMKGVNTLFMGHYIISKSGKIQPSIVSLQDEVALKDLLREAVSTGDINDWNRLFTGVSALYPKSHVISVTLDCGEYGTKEIQIPLVKELFEGSLRSVLMRYVGSVIYNHAIEFNAKKIYIGASSSKMKEPVFYSMRDYLRDNFKRMGYFANLGEEVEILPLPDEGVMAQKPAMPKNAVGMPLETQKKGMYIGVDVGASRIKGVVIKDGKLIRQEVRDTTFAGGNELKSLIMKMIENLSGKEKVSGIGISLPGVVDSVRNKVLWLVNYEYRWIEGNLRKEGDPGEDYDALSGVVRELSEKYGTGKIGIINDATAFGFTELALRQGQKGVLLSIGTGTGTARIDDGYIDIGRIEQSGGFVINVSDEAPFDKGCSVKGCFASYVGAAGIMDISRKLGLPQLLKKSLLGPQDISRLLDTDIGAGYAESKRLYSELAKRIASWIKLMKGMKDDRKFVLTGGNTTGQAGREMVTGIRSALKNEAGDFDISTPLSDLEREYGGAMGAAFFAMTRTEGIALFDEPLIGHKFTAEEVDAIELIPWNAPGPASEDFRTAVEIDLPKAIEKLPAPPGLRKKLLDTLEVFKKGQDGCRMGMTPARYVNADRYMLDFGTARSIGIATEFFDKSSKFYPHRLQVLFHALFHAARNREEEEEDYELEMKVSATAHLDAMRYSALSFWNVPYDLWETVRAATEKELKGPDQNLLPNVKNELGDVIRAWKLEQAKVPTRMAEDNWKVLLQELRALLRPTRPDAEKIFKFLNLCTVNPNPIFGDPHRYPTESRYPILRAVSLLPVDSKRNFKKKLLDIFERPENAYMLESPIVDSIILMLNSIHGDWVKSHAPELEGRRIWDVSPEIWHAGGGLGRVKQFEGVEMAGFLKQAGIPLAHIEPYYYRGKNRKTGELERLDYNTILGITVDATAENKLQEVFRIPVQVGADTALAVCYRAINEHGIETFLIKGFRKGQDVEKDAPYYTQELYGYDEWYADGKYNPNHGLTRDEFAYFFSAASLELIQHVEQAVKFSNKSWKAPVLHFSDGQLGFAPYLKKTRYANDPVLKDAFVAFTTHTYFNRQMFQQKFAQEVPQQTYLLRPSGISYEDEMKYFQHQMDLSEKPEDKYQPVCDYSSAGIRCADWVNGVSAEHVRRLLQLEYDTWGSWSKVVDFVAVTNGDVRRLTAARFREAMRQACGNDVDVEEPTPAQILKTKQRAKEMLNEEHGTKLDTSLPVISYSGRGVDEKAGRYRALSDYNIEELVKRGVQVVIGCNVQADNKIVDEWRKLEARLGVEKERSPENYKGAFILMRNSDIMLQRAILAASDFQIQDSDPVTEAAGFSEADISACGGIEIAPPWREGILQMQGVRMNLEVPGEGNYLIPAIEVSENDFPLLRRPYNIDKNREIGDAYLAIIDEVLKLGDTMEETMKKLSNYQATSVRLSRVLEARLTVAEYLRQWSQAVAEKERHVKQIGSEAPETKPALSGSIKNGLETLIGIPGFFTTGVTFEQFKSTRLARSDIHRTTSQDELKELENLGILEVNRSKKAYRYFAPSDIRNLSPPERKTVMQEILAIDGLGKREITDEEEIVSIRAAVNSVIKRHLSTYDVETVLADVKKYADQISDYIRGEATQLDLNHSIIIMRKGLPESAAGIAALPEAIRENVARIIRQGINKLNGKDIIEVSTREELVSVMNDIIDKDKEAKIIVLDDDTLTNGLDAGKGIPGVSGEAGRNYCAVTTGMIRGLESKAIPFVNIQAMAMMGVGVLYDKTYIFDMAYRAFTGHETPPDLISDLTGKIKWLIKALPRIVRFTDEISSVQRLKKLFEISA